MRGRVSAQASAGGQADGLAYSNKAGPPAQATGASSRGREAVAWKSGAITPDKPQGASHQLNLVGACLPEPLCIGRYTLKRLLFDREVSHHRLPLAQPSTLVDRSASQPTTRLQGVVTCTVVSRYQQVSAAARGSHRLASTDGRARDQLGAKRCMNKQKV